MQFFKEKLRVIITCLFLAVEVALAIMIQTTIGITSVVCFSSVTVALGFALTLFRLDLDYFATCVALLLTVCADVFLVLLFPQNKLAGMILFLFVQIAYGFKMFLQDKTKTGKVVHLSTRVGLVILAVTLTIVVLGEKADAVSVISMAYYANLLLNIVLAFMRKNFVFAVGLVCFALCDALIGLQVLSEVVISFPEGSFIYALLHPPFNLVWAFYLPSQTLIALSLLRKRENGRVWV